VKLYLDANVVIYGHEADDYLKQAVLARLSQWVHGEQGDLATSAFSRLECRVVPLRNLDVALLADYDDFFMGDAVEIVEVSLPIIDRATELRAAYGFKSPDAIHLATALHVGASRFLTADATLQRCADIEVEVIRPSSIRPPLAGNH
jgi:predicted nucleic acid-binding protein